MTNILLIITVCFAIISIYLLLTLLSRKRRLSELKQKTDFAVKSHDLVKVEMAGDDLVADVAGNFNTLGASLGAFRMQSKELKGIVGDQQVLNSKLKDFEDSLTQLNLLTDIGRQITSSLNNEEIIQKLFKFINSSMMADELNLLINKDGKPLFYSVYNGKISEIQNETWIDDKDNILNWCFDNNKEVFLNDAPVDYARYFFKPPMMQNNVVVGSVIGVPLNLGSKMIGSIGIVCKSKNVFNNYHLDFSRSIASYVSIAIYNANLYGELGEEKQKSEDLLLNILPGEVATELKQKGKSEAKLYKNVSVLFTDFVSFTSISSKMSPAELVDEIDYCFKIFDEITTRHGLEKIKTIGDAYLAVCGLPNENQNHAMQAINAAHDIRDFIHTPDKYFAKYSSGDGYLMYRNLKKQCSFSSIRIGVNSGPVVAGIVGSRKFAYDIWGDTVNTASRIETLGEAGRVNISGSTYELVKDKFNFIERGKIEAKGKGEIDMYFVEP